jgi:serine/threonine-protein kinase
MDVSTAAGQVLGGRYEIEDLLGRGGMAVVWRGRDRRLDRPVAIKEMLLGLPDPVAMKRFDREARVAARLAHPNIVAVHDVGTDGDRHYIVMELVEGRTVAAMLADGPLPVADAVAIAEQACDGLAAAHAAGIIHRDIKPANLVRTGSGVVKICDFGIARALLGSEDTDLTGPTLAMGSSQYMAPEQVNGDPIDARTDLYALGCTLYAMLTGEPPFCGGTMLDTLHRHCTEPPVPVGERRADVPPALAELTAHLLAKEPADRPTDAADVQNALRALWDAGTADAFGGERPDEDLGTPLIPPARVPAVAAPPEIATDAGHDSRQGRPVWRHRLLVVGIVAFLTAVVAWLLTVDRDPSRDAAGATDTSPTSTAVPAASATATPSPTTSQPPDTATRPSVSNQPSRPAQPAPTDQPTSSAPSVDAIAATRTAIGQQVNTGNLNPGAAGDLYKKVDEIARAMNRGDTNEVTKKLGDLRNKLNSLANEGKLSVAGRDALLPYLDRIADEM